MKGEQDLHCLTNRIVDRCIISGSHWFLIGLSGFIATRKESVWHKMISYGIFMDLLMAVIGLTVGVNT